MSKFMIIGVVLAVVLFVGSFVIAESATKPATDGGSCVAAAGCTCQPCKCCTCETCKCETCKCCTCKSCCKK